MRKESEKMKKCQKCGAEYEEDKKFCKRCGSPLLEVDKNSEQNDQDGFQDWKEDNEEAGDEQQSGKSEKSIIQSTRTKIFSLSAFFNA